MSSNKITGIRTFKDLKSEKARLRSEISGIEHEFKTNSILKISSTLFSKERHSESVFKRPLSFLAGNKYDNSLTGDLIHTTENLLGTFLISNKFTRKYFIGYTIAKEMIPFAVKKFNEIFKEKTKYY